MSKHRSNKRVLQDVMIVITGLGLLGLGMVAFIAQPIITIGVLSIFGIAMTGGK
jgi:hypothetical protein